MIILEGPDCGGKSTFAEKISDKYNASVTHYNTHDRMHMIKHAVHGRSGTHEVVDRFHYSEIPYSLYYRNTQPDYVGTSMITRALLARQAITILCLPSWGEVKRKWYGRKKNELIRNESVLRRVYKWYDSIRSDGIPLVKYDYTSDSFEYTMERVKALIKARPHSSIIDGEPCGRFYSAKVLLVGETVGNSVQQEVPFTGTRGSGPWFTQQLLDANIAEADLAWINVKLSDDTSNMINVIDACKTYEYEHVIALGNVASIALDKAHIEHTTDYHPQYWKRFNNKRDYPLIAKLKEII